MDQLTAGALAMGFCVAGAYFVRFWWDSGDRLFALFALAFFLMAVSRAWLALSGRPAGEEGQYWVRFVAFALILGAILDKNWPRRRPAPG